MKAFITALALLSTPFLSLAGQLSFKSIECQALKADANTGTSEEYIFSVVDKGSSDLSSIGRYATATISNMAGEEVSNFRIAISDSSVHYKSSGTTKYTVSQNAQMLKVDIVRKAWRNGNAKKLFIDLANRSGSLESSAYSRGPLFEDFQKNLIPETRKSVYALSNCQIQ